MANQMDSLWFSTAMYHSREQLAGYSSNNHRVRCGSVIIFGLITIAGPIHSNDVEVALRAIRSVHDQMTSRDLRTALSSSFFMSRTHLLVDRSVNP